MKNVILCNSSWNSELIKDSQGAWSHTAAVAACLKGKWRIWSTLRPHCKSVQHAVDKKAAPSPTANLAFSAVTDHFSGVVQCDWCPHFLRWSLEVQHRDASHKNRCIKRRMKSKCDCGVEIVSISEKEEALMVTLLSFASTWGELFF